jgi:hypothetical protein
MLLLINESEIIAISFTTILFEFVCENSSIEEGENFFHLKIRSKSF